MGYKRIITYILESEKRKQPKGGRLALRRGPAGGKEWTGARKPPVPLYPQEMKNKV